MVFWRSCKCQGGANGGRQHTNYSFVSDGGVLSSKIFYYFYSL